MRVAGTATSARILAVAMSPTLKQNGRVHTEGGGGRLFQFEPTKEIFLKSPNLAM